MTDQNLPREAGAFEIGDSISRSNSSEVFASIESATGAPCIVKRYVEATQATREARALSMLDGERAPQLLSRRTVEGAPSLVMERLRGRTLERWVADSDGPARESGISAVLSSLADALDHVHAKGLVHGDLKPDHIVLEPGGRVRLLDFASASAAGDRASASDVRWLTPGYAAPECHPDFSGDERLGAWTDYFSVGAILFWLAQGRAPQEADLDRPPSGEGGLAEAARRLLRREPSDRPLSAEEFRKTLLTKYEPAENHPEPESKPESEPVVVDETTVVPGAPEPEPPIFADSRDPIPPTERVRRRLPGQLPEPPRVEAPRREGGASWLAITACLAVLAAAGWAGYTYGWPLYQKLYKKDWLVDPTGAGDALTIAEALDRAGLDIEIQLAAGEHPAAPIANRSVALGPADGAATAPVIIGGDEPCMRLQDARVHLAGVSIARIGDAATGGCVEIRGGEAILANVALEGAAADGLTVGNGANVRLSALEISNPKGGGLIVSTGGEVSAEGIIVGGAMGAGVVVDGGGYFTGSEVKIIAPKSTGLAVGGGADVTLNASEIDGAGETGVELTEGADVLLQDMLIDSATGAGVALYDGARFEMLGGTITGSALSGVFADGAAQLTLSGTKIVESKEHGVLLLGLKDGRISGAEITGNEGIGLGVFPGVEVELSENRVTDNKGGDLIDARPKDPAETPADATTAPPDDPDAAGEKPEEKKTE